MIKLFFIALLFVTQAIQSCNNCWGYSGRRLRRQAIEQVPCDCNCAQQYHIRYDDRQGYGCIRCGHRLVPTNQIEKATKTEKTMEENKKSIKKNKRSVTYSAKYTNVK